MPVRSSSEPRAGFGRRDLIVGTLIASVMALAFASLSSGLSLIVTFLPGLALAWLLFVMIYARRADVPDSDHFTPLFFGTLAVQFLHFAEEYVTGFDSSFPRLYGGAPYSQDLFVVFNMAAYAAFTLGCVFGIQGRVRFLMMPVLFFLTYGVIGNAIAHTWWSIQLRDYFPGLVTAQAYWLLGPLLLYRILPSWKQVAGVIAVFAFLLIVLLGTFATPLALQL